MTLGEAFSIVKPGYSKPHLWVVVSHPDPAGFVLMYSLTSFKDGCDTTCLIKPGEHIWVVHDTIVLYDDGRLFPAAQSERLLRSRSIRRQRPVSRALLAKIQHGAFRSPCARPIHQKMVRASLAVAESTP